jgi:hypothetical protein
MVTVEGMSGHHPIGVMSVNPGKGYRGGMRSTWPAPARMPLLVT